MRQLTILLACLLLGTALCAQNKKAAPAHTTLKNELPALQDCLHTAGADLPLYTQNLASHALEHDVNSIILDIEKYIDSMPRTKSRSDELLMKYFAPLRHFFLTTTNKTSVATEFLYSDAPYRFCTYHDTALALYIGAVKDDETYDLGKTTDRRIAKNAFENCLLPSLAALGDFKDSAIKYVALSIYYGCRDTREGAPAVPAAPYCLTLVARMADVQQYAAGNLTEKGLVERAEVFLGDGEEMRNVKMW